MVTFELDITSRQTELNNAFGDPELQRDQQREAVNDLKQTEDHISVQLETTAQEIHALEKELADLQAEHLSLAA